KKRVRIGNYGNVEIFRVGRAPLFPEFKELHLEKRLPSTICTAMKYSVESIVRNYMEQRVSYASLERELKLTKVLSQMERHI
ncbi:MAG: hypothetical protein JSW40_00700, partial [Candidatus Omnitrophota bacterium]